MLWLICLPVLPSPHSCQKLHPVPPPRTSHLLIDTYIPPIFPTPPPGKTPHRPQNTLLQTPGALEPASALLSAALAFGVDGAHDVEAVAGMGDDAVIAHCGVLQRNFLGCVVM